MSGHEGVTHGPDLVLTSDLCSPDETIVWRGLERVEVLLESDPDAIDVPALVLVANNKIGRSPLKDLKLRQKAAELIERLPRPPENRESVGVGYFLENAGSEVITRLIELSVTHDRSRGESSLRWSLGEGDVLPSELARFTELSEISMFGLERFPEVLLDMPWLRSIDFFGSKIAALPPRIARLQQVQALNLQDNRLDVLPDEFGELTRLKQLDLSGNRLTAVPETLANLTSLETLALGGNPMASVSQVEALFEEFCLKRTDIAARRVQINLMFARNERACAVGDVRLLIDALDAGPALVRGNARIALDMMLAPAYRDTPLEAGTKLAVIGKSGLSEIELSASLEKHGIGVGARIEADTTHVLIGEHLDERRDALYGYQGVFLTERMLVSFLREIQPPFFLDAAQDTRDAQARLIELLMSEDCDNQTLALEMLKGTGVSRKLMTPLYLLFVLAEDEAVGEAARVLLMQNASPAFIRFISLDQEFESISHEQGLTEHLHELEHFEEIDTLEFARLIYQRRLVGLKYLLEHAPGDEVAPMLAAKVDEGCLDLTSHALSRLPEGVGEIKDITELRLFDNRLTSLPDTLSGLRRLSEIDITANRFTILPESLGTVMMLGKLDAPNNEITSLPDALAGLEHLSELNVSHNRLMAITDSLGTLRSLTRLDISHNRLVALPESLAGAVQLMHLDVSHNKLTGLPRGLSALRTLNVSDNCLSEFPEGLLDCEALLELNLFGNALDNMPANLSALRRLESLEIGWQGMQALPGAVATLPALKSLTLMSANLTSLPAGLGSLDGLKTLSLSRCKMRELPEGLSELQGLEALNVPSKFKWRAKDLMPATCKIGL